MKIDRFGKPTTPEQAEVRVYKRNHFTVTPIKDLAAWKAEQASQQAKWEAGRAERYATAKAACTSIMDGTTVAKLTDLEKAELSYRSQTRKEGFEFKWAHTSPTDRIMAELADESEDLKPSLKERVVSWCLKLLSNAFPS